MPAEVKFEKQWALSAEEVKRITFSFSHFCQYKSKCTMSVFFIIQEEKHPAWMWNWHLDLNSMFFVQFI